MSRPIQASALAMVGADIVVLTATLVQPDFGAALPKGPRAPIIVTGRNLDAVFLNDLAQRFLLSNVRLHFGDTSSEPDEAHLALRDGGGQIVATLDWSPQTPGTKILGLVAGPLGLTLGLLGLAAVFLQMRVRRGAQELVESEARAAHLAYFDTLTGHPNRNAFLEKLTQGLEQARRGGPTLAVVAISMDRFKEVNDAFGYQVGDDLVRQVAPLIASQCRNVDVFARLSADSFAVIQYGATPQAAARFAARLLRAVEKPVELSAGPVSVGASIGISMIVEAQIETAEALRQAELALFRAKQDGGGRFCFFEIEMDAAVKMRRALEADLRAALAADGLHMVYQPQVDRRGRVTGVEALVRWTHPERGALSPAFFVPIAEECGLIRQLGVFTLRRAFEDSRRWPDLRVAVNVSAKQLSAPDFVEEVKALVDEFAIEPRQFELEITEGVILVDDPAVHGTLRKLRSLGFTFALDDFGTGYSSLSYLHKFPINKIKIDRAFVSNLDADGEGQAVVSAIIRLARALKLNVIAEGVETPEQRERLLAAGCADIQGYLVSKPVTPDAVEAFCASNPTDSGRRARIRSARQGLSPRPVERA